MLNVECFPKFVERHFVYPVLGFFILHSAFCLLLYIIPGRLKPAVALPISALEISLAWLSA